MSITNYPLVPSPPYLNRWFQDALTYDTLRPRVLSGELHSLLTQDRAFLQAFVSKQAVIHRAAKKNDEPFIKALVVAGADLGTVDEEGNSVLVHVLTAEMFLWLQEKGAPFIHGKNTSLLQFVFGRSSNEWYSIAARAEWLNLLIRIMPSAPLEDFSTLGQSDLSNLIGMAKDNHEIRTILLGISARLVKERPRDLLPIAQKLLARHDWDIFKMGFIELIKMGVVTDPFIEQIITDPTFLVCNTNHFRFFNTLAECWMPQGDLLALTQFCGGDLRLGVYIHAILNTTTLNEAASLYSRISNFPVMKRLDERIKERLLNHLLMVQEKDNSTIWIAITSHIIGSEDLLLMKTLGFDPHWIDPVKGQTFLFTERARVLEYDEGDTIGFDPDHVDLLGNNAMEHHCRQGSEDSIACLKALAHLGIRLGDQFPNIQKCRNIFPNSPYLQAALGASLLHTRKCIIREILRSMSSQDSSSFSQAVRTDPELKNSLGKYLESESFGNGGLKSWKNSYHPADVQRLEQEIQNRWSKEWDLAFLAKFWNGIVPSVDLNVIPRSPLASLIVCAITIQHRNLVEGRIKKPVSPRKLFCETLNRDDMVHLNRYLFAHPEVMRILVQDYMNARGINIKAGDGSTTTYGKIISHLMIKTGKLLQLPDHQGDLPKWHQRLLNSFEERIAPVPAETLDIPDSAIVDWVGRTAVVTSDDGSESFKFLRKGEKYEYFAQEHSVCKALREIAGQFRSRIIRPIGVYAIKHLPQALTRDQHELTGNGPSFVFHYQTLPDTYVYLQDVAPCDYAESRSKTLHDAAKLIRLGIYPDLAAIFHNHQASRRYVLLVDVMVRLMQSPSKFSLFPPAGGAGRLENPLKETKYSNARKTGMTDWRDARRYYSKEDSLSSHVIDMDGVPSNSCYFFQMQALSNVLLIDMLILAERYINAGVLQWQNEALNEKFGMELAEGFALLSACYSDQSIGQSFNFALGSGIDWTRAARQIAFWLDAGPEGYPAWVASGKVPPGLYEESIHIEVDVSKSKNFDKARGFRTNGSLDIGAYNGPLALDQFEKAAHLLFNAIALAEPLSPPPEPIQEIYRGVPCSDWMEY